MPAAIEVKHVSKFFRLYHEHYSSLKERVIHFGRVPFEDFVALDNIDIEIEEGSTVGILGHNGSGKSTLLKCMAGILQPNEGEIVTAGGWPPCSSSARASTPSSPGARTSS